MIYLWDFNGPQMVWVGFAAARSGESGGTDSGSGCDGGPASLSESAFMTVAAGVEAHAGVACASTPSWELDGVVVGDGFLRSCQLRTSVGYAVSGSGGNKVGRRSFVRRQA